MTAVVPAFLAGLGWGNGVCTPLAQDGSARRYDRVALPGRTAVLMQAPPEDRHSFDQFLKMADWLREQGFSVPEIFGAEPATGLMLLEDFGDTQMAGLATGSQAHRFFAAVTDMLVALAGRSAPDWMQALGPAALARQSALALEECPGERALDPAAWVAQLQEVLSARLGPADTVALRDLHGENVMWLPDRDGVKRVGLLDFQDAVRAPLGYDLISLLDDPRRVVPEALGRAMTDRFTAAMGLPQGQLDPALTLLSLARNIRILGIFRRLARVRSTPSYLRFLPRTAELIARAAARPEARPLRPEITAILAAHDLQGALS